jgi:diguanylate cyclase (GGDEF)-like protein
MQAVGEAERIRERLESTVVEYDGTKIPVTASLGVTQFLPGQSASELYDEADEKLYAAKKAGRNRIQY